MSELDALTALLTQLSQREREYRLDYYKPYGFQKEFHEAKGYQTDVPAKQRCLMAANGVGKTLGGGMETAYHLTGLYPKDWNGTRFNRPVELLASGKTNDAVKSVIQKELFGDPLDDTKLGTGSIPLHCLIKSKITRKPGVPNAIQDALIKHVSGGHSKISLMAYEQKAKAFMGIRFDVGWADEEPPMDIWGQLIRGTLSRPDAILYITFTPEEGTTAVVEQFMNDLRPGQALITATWDDAPHMGPAEKEQKLNALPAHEREMRSKGIPQMGSGLVFPVLDEDLEIEPFQIPQHWPHIIGVDFGYDHPFAAVNLAWDRDSDTVYLTNEYRERKTLTPMNAAAVKPWGEWKPVVWPHDGLQHDKGSGEVLAEQFKAYGLNMLRDKFSNPPAPGQKEGSGGNGVEAGIMDMLTRMETGRFKVFKTCRLWMEEKRMYHRQDGKIVKLRDDLISASRYACMSLRHAQTRTVAPPRRRVAVGASNW